MKILPVCRACGGAAIFEGFDKKGFSNKKNSQYRNFSTNERLCQDYSG